jgi:hypothetical protein
LNAPFPYELLHLPVVDRYVGKQFADAAIQMRGQAAQHIVEVGPWVVALELGGLHQTHHDGIVTLAMA